MKIHEYQARQLLTDSGIPVPPGAVIHKPEQAADAYQLVTSSAGTDLAVVKAQVFAGGRGKAGFVKLVRSAADATDAARFMLSNKMVSVQTGPEGLEVNKLLVAAGVDIAKEYYLAITTDRNTRKNVMIASSEGGVEIEKVAAENPDAIIKTTIDPLLGLQAFQAREVAYRLGMKGKQIAQAVKIMLNLATLYDVQDCTLAEINPLIVTPPTAEHPDGRVLAIDAKFQFDDNGVFRHKNQQEMRDTTEDDPNEARAAEVGLNYIALDGNIGCLVNGAGRSR
ncbi:MAG: ATP-grasp domain-containing protein [Phycisphaerales bacterium]